MNEEARKRFAADLTDKKIRRVYYEDGDTESGPYWVLELHGGGEFCFRTMAEILQASS